MTSNQNSVTSFFCSQLCSLDRAWWGLLDSVSQAVGWGSTASIHEGFAHFSGISAEVTRTAGSWLVPLRSLSFTTSLSLSLSLWACFIVSHSQHISLSLYLQKSKNGSCQAPWSLGPKLAWCLVLPSISQKVTRLAWIQEEENRLHFWSQEQHIYTRIGKLVCGHLHRQAKQIIIVQGRRWEISLKDKVREASWRRSHLSLVLSHGVVTQRQETFPAKGSVCAKAQD